MNRVVLDLNFWLSVFISKKNSLLLDTIEKHDLEIFSCEEFRKDLESVFYHKDIFKRKLFPPFDSYLEFHAVVSETIAIQYRGGLIHDYKDKLIYDLCIQSRTRILVTNDSDFDVLKKFKRPEIIIMSTAEFWKVFK
ncbi:hypothetical protein LBMAG27_12320 [Bacteroidota bacterium]|nr:hypothetical protein LBMAG27_12320 [Bacteroidota bacterium]